MNDKTFTRFLLSAVTFAGLFSFASFDAQAQDTPKVKYSLFHPVPKEKMRKEMETDRPNFTETPLTVDAGHFQYEADLGRFEHQTTSESDERRWLINQADLKFGLLPNTSLQLIVQTFGHQVNKELENGEKEFNRGFGDLTLRIKQNIYGNYDGNFSIALMPYIKFPTNRYSDNKLYEEGLMIPMLLQLPHDWKIGMQVEGDYLKDDDADASRHADLQHSVVISHVLFKKLEVFAETYYSYNFKNHHVHNFVDTALEYEITPDFKIDAGINYGFQKAAQKDYFLGLAFRY
ncbi:transporter [Mucilaginibacter sp. Bleaf8]|uniref:transporter n=1 Tax=Mucilaginibacter sp. Bleaf8 TaxID=2834430 RepID=UPI001BD008B7|nr:transporter [Mucilaginibacter sp. Bleaf8]MBS7564058.1 transporter [Mucilaginibacter sp. Bleaf8]